MNNDKLEKGVCQSYLRNGSNELVKCTRDGDRRYDHNLDSGIHCQECWEKLIYECRQRSW